MPLPVDSNIRVLLPPRLRQRYCNNIKFNGIKSSIRMLLFMRQPLLPPQLRLLYRPEVQPPPKPEVTLWQQRRVVNRSSEPPLHRYLFPLAVA
jgi:hypothetical protein